MVSQMTEMRELWRYLLLSLGEVLAVVLVYGVIFHEHFLTVWQEEGAAWIFLAVILVALGNYLFFKRQAKRRLTSQALLLKKLSELVEDQPSRHVLLPKDDEYYQLSRLVNRLQSKQRSLLRNYQQQNRDYLTLLQSLTSGVIVFDQRKETVLYNHVLASILNTTELKGQPFYQVFTPGNTHCRACGEWFELFVSKIVHVEHHLEVLDGAAVVKGDELDIFVTTVGAHPPFHAHFLAYMAFSRSIKLGDFRTFHICICVCFIRKNPF